MSTVETAVGRFVWHDHLSEDSEAATRFYGELLAWDFAVWEPGEMDYPMIKVGGEMHGGFGPAQGAPPLWLGHIQVEDVDAAAARAEGAGGRIVVPALDIPEVGRTVVVADPQGTVVSLFAPAGGPPAGEGVFVWDELLTTDVEAATRFYGEVAGWTTGKVDMGEGAVYTLFRSGEVDRGGAFPLPEEAQGPPYWLTYVGIDDVDATMARARELGASTVMEPLDVPEVGRFAVLADPTGALFGLFRPSEG